tara:strand:+ start:1260 stop:1499 length:240 start_codon:yes stop_codon:yes gene_type:complete
MPQDSASVAFLNVSPGEVLSLVAQALSEPRSKKVRLSHFTKHSTPRPGLSAIGFKAKSIMSVKLPRNNVTVLQMELFYE